jgi:hypothetical protein
MKYFMLSIMENFGLESLWEVLGRKPAQLFGRECASSAIWMIISLLIRFIVILLKVDNYFPRGIIFAFPYAMQVITAAKIKTKFSSQYYHHYTSDCCEICTFYERKHSFNASEISRMHIRYEY